MKRFIFIMAALMCCVTMTFGKNTEDTTKIEIKDLSIDEIMTKSKNVYSEGKFIVLEGFENEIVYIYEIGGRMICAKKCYSNVVRIEMPYSGIYAIFIGYDDVYKVVVK